MATIHRSALVMHSAEAMFQLVNDILSYPKFLPWCTDAKLVSESPQEVVARLRVSKGRVGHSFTTRNQLLDNQRINMELVDGPFKYLRGDWQFNPLNDKACKITLDLDFEFSSRIKALALGRVFNQTANSMVDAFCQRANKIYG